MVYTGRPSAGCASCRKSKKRCDQQVPACGRCVRLGKECGGYRDVSDLMFRDESHSVSRRLNTSTEAGPSSGRPSPPKRSSPDNETRARSFFFEHFVAPSYLSSLEGLELDGFLLQPVLACALHVIAQRQGGNPMGLETARKRYVDAIHRTNLALRSPKTAKQDSSLIAVLLLSTFERLAWDSSMARENWSQHVQGLALILQLRGRDQLETKLGADLFRDIQSDMIVNALHNETAVPAYIVEWSQFLDADEAHLPIDQIMLIASSIALIRQSFRIRDKVDDELLAIANDLEFNLQKWAETTSSNPMFAYRSVQDASGDHAFAGVRHEYGSPQAFRYWNLWRVLQILLSRLQEALWRRSWPVLASPELPIPQPDHFRSIRNRMVNEICITTCSVFGNDNAAQPPAGSVASGQVLLNPLTTAGTCLLESLAEITISPEGGRLILLDRPYHLDPYNQTSTQLAWVIQKVDYLAEKVGIRAARSFSEWLRGEDSEYFDLGRS
ncbi:hypothetical protein M409DRAFT_63572 [Zasmidium cellare ATCC 36951]|uniref:Zn(2)-C6 fungal-type domain-containing protein n=1 Tax=Zasmidium cellare ATCC 36951 TaxID=1080233 RepID=A0A6A6CYD1_ZASCE|nr:uncharacterized protein M409DRAFT_63572 [Zasmidium cellare ATCC 36951]KAF2171200.1 hypothetical protein M409DRAFT_63572 [Zasmidium cellare ATCC 36951]